MVIGRSINIFHSRKLIECEPQLDFRNIIIIIIFFFLKGVINGLAIINYLFIGLEYSNGDSRAGSTHT